MPTIREQIIQAAVSAVNANRPDDVPECTRTKLEPTENGSLPALTCFPYREIVTSTKPGGRWGPTVDRVLYLRFVAQAQGKPADASADPILAWLTKALGGQTFNGLTDDTQESEITYSYDEGTFQVVSVAQDFKIEYQTLRADATAIN